VINRPNPEAQTLVSVMVSCADITDGVSGNVSAVPMRGREVVSWIPT
jgi:lysophospholipase L1-like esterase